MAQSTVEDKLHLKSILEDNFPPNWSWKHIWPDCVDQVRPCSKPASKGILFLQDCVYTFWIRVEWVLTGLSLSTFEWEWAEGAVSENKFSTHGQRELSMTVKKWICFLGQSLSWSQQNWFEPSQGSDLLMFYYLRVLFRRSLNLTHAQLLLTSTGDLLE